ncbi:MAG: ABC transporter permease [Ignavibacteriaceae bacterium]
MFKNYLTIAFRNIQRQKLFTFIIVCGLAIGIAACMIISLWVKKELSYDRFHSKADRIFRIERKITRNEIDGRWPITGAKYKQALIDDIPEIKNAVRLWPRAFSIKDKNDNLHRQQLFAVDNSIFDIFDFVLNRGSKATALSKPNTLVLTESCAIKYFGTQDVVGKTLELEMDNKYVNFEITGVLKDVPENSHIHFEMLISFSILSLYMVILLFGGVAFMMSSNYTFFPLLIFTLIRAKIGSLNRGEMCNQLFFFLQLVSLF